MPDSAGLFRQADAILDAALDLAPQEQAAFVERACRGNAALRTLMQRLLRAHAREDGLLAGHAIDVARPLLGPPEDGSTHALPVSALPERIGPFRIIRALGHGGMGLVYLAQRDGAPDEPPVALKVLRDGSDVGGSALRRFLAERRIVSQLEHPHVARLLETGITADGAPFFAMLHCAGGSLAQRLAQGPLGVPEAVRVAGQLAAALGAAHGLGIVHRDVKPANVLFDAAGGAQLTDFGIAKLLDQETTLSGALLGTPAYLAPEQLRGLGVDHRVDLWALGVVLYQMLSGRRPFDGPTYAAVLHAVRSVEPGPRRRPADDVPPALEALMRHLLQKEPDARPQTADEVGRVLQAIAGNPAARYVPSTPYTPSASTPSLQSRPASIAVLPLANTGGNPDDAPLCDGLTDELIGALGKVRGIRVTARTTVFALRGRQLDARTVAHMLGVSHLLEGSVRRAGDRLKVSAQLVRAEDASVAWSEAYDRKLEDVFSVQEEVARAIVTALAPAFAVSDGPALAARPRDLAAYEAFLKGRYFWEGRTPPDLFRATEYFEQAVAIDPSYAEAYAGLADAHLLLVAFGSQPPHTHLPRLRWAMAEALRLGSDLADVHATHGNVLSAAEWDWAGAEAALRRALDTEPGHVRARLYLAIVLQHLGRCDEAVAVCTAALASDPLSPPLNMTLGRAHLHAGRAQEALRPLQTAVEIAPGFAFAQRQLGDALLLVGRHAEALDAFRRAAMNDAPQDVTHLAYALARTGAQAEARSLLQGLLAREAHGYLPPFGIAQAYAGLGENDAAMQWLERGFGERAGSMNCVKVAPCFAGLRDDPRFTDLLRRMNLLDAPA
ncbi:MAG: protein kinase domain-containing protein [Gemmatimonadales bacterium]